MRFRVQMLREKPTERGACYPAYLRACLLCVVLDSQSIVFLFSLLYQYRATPSNQLFYYCIQQIALGGGLRDAAVNNESLWW